jgi:hypothetical protein
MNRFQDCSQFSGLMNFHWSRGLAARELSRATLTTERLISRRSAALSRDVGKKASSPSRFRTTPGDPRSMTTLESASILAAPVRIESCNQDCATFFYDTASTPVQLTMDAPLFVTTVLSKSALPDIEINLIERSDR